MVSLALIAAEGMSSAAIDRVPTLTEVVEWAAVELRHVRALPAPPALASAAAASDPNKDMPLGLVTELSADLLFELERSVGLALEARLREALAPVLARVADAMIREAQQELSATMGKLVEEAVTRAIERHTNL